MFCGASLTPAEMGHSLGQYSNAASTDGSSVQARATAWANINSAVRKGSRAQIPSLDNMTLWLCLPCRIAFPENLLPHVDLPIRPIPPNWKRGHVTLAHPKYKIRGGGGKYCPGHTVNRTATESSPSIQTIPLGPKAQNQPTNHRHCCCRYRYLLLKF